LEGFSRTSERRIQVNGPGYGEKERHLAGVALRPDRRRETARIVDSGWASSELVLEFGK
jgi:hypothetical protein